MLIIDPPGSTEAIAFSHAEVITFSLAETVDPLCIDHQFPHPHDQQVIHRF